jgi:glycosyltransferase involved in cell wall biosynthesis
MAFFGSLTVFLPAWNEEANLRQAVAAARETCDDLVEDGEIEDYEVLVIDDASTDATPVIARELADADKRIRVIRHEQNRKLGGCLKTGFGSARGDIILYTDADLPCDLAELRKACRLLRIYGADVVSAYRHDRTGEGTVRAVYSFVYNWLVRLLFGVWIRDVNFAFKLCRRSVFDHVCLASEGSFIDAELLVRCHLLGYRIIQFGVDYFPRWEGRSTLSSWPVVVKILREMAALGPELKRLRPAETLKAAP